MAVASALAGCQSGEVREYYSYPASLDDVPKLLEQHFDIIVIGLDSQPEYALELVESICASGSATVMVYSEKTDAELLVRCMRAGAREFLTLPIAQDIMAEALARAAARRPATRPAKKAGGRLLVFLGAKGGDGVTTLACNFAVALAQESSQTTLLIDLDLPLGDAALNLGVAAEYSTINALQNASRLDSSFLSKLLVKHSSGVSVLAAPGKFPQFPASNEAIDRLIQVARLDFENVVIDMGSRLDLMGTSLFKEGSTIYLVIQAGIAGLRNSNRLISQYFSTDVPKLEIVLNRFQSRSLGVAEEQITKALTRPAQWKIPNDYNAVRRMQHTAIPLALEDSPISRLIRQMARTASGLPATQEKGSGFSLKKISRSLSAKISSSEEVPAPIQPIIALEPDSAVLPSGATQSDAPANVPETPGEAQSADAVPAAVAPSQITPEDASDPTDRADEAAPEQQCDTTTGQPAEPETRSYKGATYVRGEDGQWHLQRTQTGEVVPETPVIAWSTPAPIAYGAMLSAPQLNAMASVPGAFAYAPPAGDLLPVGEHTLSVTFTPADAEGYTTAQATVQLNVTQATPAILWPAPAVIAYGTVLSATELNATASVPGDFVYTPAEGELLPAGEHALTAAFTPADPAGYTDAKATAQLTVSQATPTISWPAPASIAYGTTLGANQLNATASVPGDFVYTPAAGEVLQAGAQTLSAAFTPADAANYTTAQAAVQLTVTQATPIITWPAPAPISYGVTLGADQINATALVPGTFVYAPSAGEVLGEGTHTLTATFTPTDAVDYATVQATASLTVTKAMPEIVSPPPAAISEDVAPAAPQLIVEPQPALPMAAPAEDRKPVVKAKPAPRKLKTKPPVEVAQEAPAEVPVEPSVELPADAPVVAPAMPSLEIPAEVPVMAPAKPSLEIPAEVPVMAPAEPSLEIPAEVPVMAPAEPSFEIPAEVPVMAPAEPSLEIPAEIPVMAPVKLSIEIPAEVAGPTPVETQTKPPAKAEVKHPSKARAKSPAKAFVKTPAGVPAETPVTALVKAQGPKAPIEVGPGLDIMGSAVFEDGTTIYLVMQPGSAGLPNSNRLVSQFFAAGGPKPDFVMNRFEPRSEGVAEGQASTAITRPAYVPVSGPIGQTVGQSADLPAAQEKKAGFSLKGLGRSIWAKIATNEKTPSFTQLGLKDEPESVGAAPASGPTLSDLTASLPEKPFYAPPQATSFAARTPMQHTPEHAADRAGRAGAHRVDAQHVTAPRQHAGPETRVYKGATYVKGADGQWHLKEAEAVAVKRKTPAIPLEMPASSASSSVQIAAEPPSTPEPTPARVAPVEAAAPAPKDEPAPSEIPVKAPSKRVAKAALKPPAKAPAKKVIKPAQKPAAKTPAKKPIKPAQKPAAKTPAKKVIKPAQKSTAKIPAKKPIKPAQKSAAKIPAKKPVKPAQKSKAKTPAKKPIKPAQKSTVKVPAKKLIKPAQKPTAKTPAKRVNTPYPKLPAKTPAKKIVKTSQKPLAKGSVHKFAYAGERSLSAPKSTPAKIVKPSKPAVSKPAPQPMLIKPSPEPAAISKPDAESAMKE